VGRELGFEHVVPKIEDPELEPICARLGLDEVIVPDREIGLRLVDAVEGRSSPELAAVVRSGLRFLSFEVPEGVSDLDGLELPDSARVVARTRGESSVLVGVKTRFEAGDLIVTIAEEDAVDGLRERFCSDSGDES
jgi:trk system potassium uptake protein TrkA